MSHMEELVDVTAVEVIGDYRLRLTFQDGTVGDVDFSRREWRGVFEPLRDRLYFARVDVDAEAGTIASRWSRPSPGAAMRRSPAPPRPRRARRDLNQRRGEHAGSHNASYALVEGKRLHVR